MIRLSIFIVLYLLCSCSDTTSNNIIKTQQANLPPCLKINNFLYDSIIHYHTNRSYLSQSNTINSDILHGNYPTVPQLQMAETTFASSNILAFQSYLVADSTYSLINDLLCEQEKPTVKSVNKCEPAYRDILVFKNQKSIVGVVKICFECNQFMYVGNPILNNLLIENKNYNSLKAILNQN